LNTFTQLRAKLAEWLGVCHVDHMLYQVGQTLGARITTHHQEVVDGVVAGGHRVQQRVADVPQLDGQNERRSHEPDDGGRGHLGVQFGAIQESDAGRDGGGQRGAVHVKQVVPVRLARLLRGGRVQEQRQVERGRPVTRFKEVHDKRVERAPAIVVLEHDATAAIVAVAQDGQRFDRFHRTSQRLHPIGQQLRPKLVRTLVFHATVTETYF